MNSEYIICYYVTVWAIYLILRAIYKKNKVIKNSLYYGYNPSVEKSAIRKVYLFVHNRIFKTYESLFLLTNMFIFLQFSKLSVGTFYNAFSCLITICAFIVEIVIICYVLKHLNSRDTDRGWI